MRLEDLESVLDAVLSSLGASRVDGEEFRSPPLVVERYWVRRVRLSRVPILGSGESVVAVVQQPTDLAVSADGIRALLERVATVTNLRFPPWPRGRGLAIGLTTVVLTTGPIGIDEDEMLARALKVPARLRCVPLAVFRLDLNGETMAHALAGGPQNVFPETSALADALANRLRRFVPLMDMPADDSG